MITVFSRRHPYLFFFLVFSAIAALFVFGVSLVVSVGATRSKLEYGPRVGVVEINGVISESRHVTADLKRLRENNDIKAIVLRIDSPGGSVGPSQEIYREVLKTKKLKKVVASMGSVAASGGYYVAAGADGIVANPGTITGSIGVIMAFTNLQELFDKIGMAPTVVKSGKYKDVGSPARPMTSDERQMLQRLADAIRNRFVRDVAAGRNMAPEEVDRLADGRIFSGEEAQQNGLVDRIGNLEDAIEWAGRLGGIEGPVEAEYATQDKYPFLKYLLESSFNGLMQKMGSLQWQQEGPGVSAHF